MNLPLPEALAAVDVAVVVPAFQAESAIAATLRTIPSWVRRIVVVDDGSTDRTADVVAAIATRDSRVTIVAHPSNRGVGAAMRSGYRRALDDGAEILAKMDADGQMDPAALASLVLPVALGRADYAKGNRFVHSREIRAMPAVRLVGNAALSLLTKLSTGYWNLLDPTNGYTAASREALAAIDLDRLDDRFFFETSMLAELSLARAVCVDVAIPARYGSESSHLSVARSVVEFGAKNARALLRRLWLRYVVFDVSPVSLMIVLGPVSAVGGALFGLRHWVRSSWQGVPATAGTVMVAAFTTAAGLVAMAHATLHDMRTVPDVPRTPPRLGLTVPAADSTR